MRRLAFLALLGVSGGLFGVAGLGQDAAPPGCDPTVTLPCLELRRNDKLIVVQQTARDSEGGLFSSRTFDEAAPCAEAGYTLTIFFAPDPKVVETRLDGMLITANVVLRTQPKGDQDAAVLEIFGGSLALDPETFCPQNVERAEYDAVTLREGRTTVKGVTLTYDNASGNGTLSGSPAYPVTLERAADGDSPLLTASAERLEFNADTPERTLTGNVRITSEERVSEADLLIYDDAKGIATLRGDPARSRKGDEFVTGRVIVYYLDTNDVEVIGGVGGELIIDLGGVTAPSPEPTPEPDAPPLDEPSDQ